MKKLKTIIVSTSRADYGLLSPLIRKVLADDSFALQLVATGSHLSVEHGETVNTITKDGFDVNYRVDMLPNGDSDDGTCISVSRGLEAFSKILKDDCPDFVIVLGDRYELLSFCIASLIHKVPIVHIHGGESTFGAIDESIRHSITKMAAVHFPSITQYGNRIIQLGEDPNRVHVVGALGIDNIKNTLFMDLEELQQFTGVDFSRNVALMTFHPVTLDEGKSAPLQVTEILDALLTTNLFTLITAPNIDAGGEAILQVIQAYVLQYSARFVLIPNLGQRAYLSALKYAKLMIGNTSSGIIESASFRIPVVNIGDRQDGRMKPDNVIDCVCRKSDIADAIGKALSEDFRARIARLENPYGDGNTAERMMEILKSIDFHDRAALIKKKFHDVPLPNYSMQGCANTEANQDNREKFTGIAEQKQGNGHELDGDAESIVLIGAGGHAKVMIESIHKYHKEFDIIGILDKDDTRIGQLFAGVPILGTDVLLDDLYEKGIRKVILSLGMLQNSQLRHALYMRVKDIGYEFINVIHGSSILSDSMKMGQGNVIMAGCILNAEVRIGDNCILNTGSIIEHETIIGNNVHIAPGATVSGQVHIDDNCLIGAGATVIHGIHIGRNCIIGAGSVVIRNIPPDSVVAGVPAKPIEEMRDGGI